jgi:FixJ family two-component response regulator
MSGPEVQKELQAVSPKTRVIMMTRVLGETVRNATIRAGAIAYFDKPFDDEAFLAAVHQGLGELDML